MSARRNLPDNFTDDPERIIREQRRRERERQRQHQQELRRQRDTELIEQQLQATQLSDTGNQEIIDLLSKSFEQSSNPEPILSPLENPSPIQPSREPSPIQP